MTKIKGSPTERVCKITWALVTLGVAVLLCACNGKRTLHTETGRGKVADSSTKHGKADTGRGEGETNLAGGRPTVAKKWVVVSVKKVRRLAAGTPIRCSWCPSDRMLYFELFGENVYHASKCDTWSVDANGDKLHQAPYEHAAYMSWSPSGNKFTHVPEAYGFLTVRDVTTGLSHQVSQHRMGGRSSWSPDGKRIVFEAFPQNPPNMGQGIGMSFKAIWVVNVDGTGERQIVDQGYNPRWLHDGGRISYSDSNGEQPRWWLAKPDGSYPQQLTVTRSRVVEVIEQEPSGVRLASAYPTQAVEAIDWSPDGEWVVFSGERAAERPKGRRGPQGPYALAVNTPDGSNEQQLLLSKGCITSPCWSPDGKRIAFLGSDTPVQVGKGTIPDYIGIVTLKESPSREVGHQLDGVHHTGVTQ